jgi:hypothetical protein
MNEEFEMLVSMLVETTGKLADLCEHAPDEEAVRQTLARAADSMRLPIIEVICSLEHDPVAEAARRLQETATERGTSYVPAILATAESDESEVTWRELQIAEAEHALACEPQLTAEQRMLRWTLRMASAAGALVERIQGFQGSEEAWKPATDLLLLSLKFSTVAGDELPDQRVPRDSAQLDVDLCSETTSWAC